MSYRVGAPEWVYGLPVDGSARLLLHRLWGYVSGTEAIAFLSGLAPAPFVFPSRDVLADILGTSKRTVRRHLKALAELGAIEPADRVVNGRYMDGWILLDLSEGADDGTDESREEAQASADQGGHPCPDPGQACPPGGHPCPSERPSVANEADIRVRPYRGVRTSINTPVNTREGASAERASPAPAPEPLELKLDEPERLDPEALAAEVIGLSAEARQDLGARTRRTKPSKADRAAVLSLAEAGPVIELPDGVADLRTAPGLRRAWALVVRRKAEELRRRAEARGEDPAALARWLLVKTLARDAAELLDNDDLDQRKPAPPRGRARASPGQGPPVNNTDLAAYADIRSDLTRFEKP